MSFLVSADDHISVPYRVLPPKRKSESPRQTSDKGVFKRYHDGDGHENVAKKVNLRSFNLYLNYFNSLTLSNASELCLSRIPNNHIQDQKEKENLPVARLRPP